MSGSSYVVPQHCAPIGEDLADSQQHQSDDDSTTGSSEERERERAREIISRWS